MPAFAGAAILFGPALARALRAGGRTALAASALGVLQLAFLAYDPRAQLPSPADREAGLAIVERLRATDGEVWMPDHGYLARIAGKGSSAHGMAVIDLLQSRDRAVAQGFLDRLARALAEKRYAAVVLDRRWDEDLPVLAQHYHRIDGRYPDESAFVPVTGNPRRPLHWYLRR